MKAELSERTETDFESDEHIKRKITKVKPIIPIPPVKPPGAQNQDDLAPDQSPYKIKRRNGRSEPRDRLLAPGNWAESVLKKRTPLSSVNKKEALAKAPKKIIKKPVLTDASKESLLKLIDSEIKGVPKQDLFFFGKLSDFFLSNAASSGYQERKKIPVEHISR